MKLTKMHGIGNDYLYHYGMLPNVEELSVRLSHRHYGIGSDGIVLILPSETADFKMRIFNADGSEARMCGNGIRCVGKYVYDKGHTDKTTLEIDTLSGIRTLRLQVENHRVSAVSVDMGKSLAEAPRMLETALGRAVGTPVDVGNPHFVLFVEDAENCGLHTLGPALEKHPYFSDGVNVEFVQKLDENLLRMRVWERGSGITMACGTGACASVAAAIRAGLCRYDEDVTVRLDGGDLIIRVSEDGETVMKGPAQTICECEVEP